MHVFLYYFINFISIVEHKFGIIYLGTFNKLGGAKLLNEGRRYNEQERFFNRSITHYYPSFSITTIYSFNIKEIHLTKH